MKKLIIAAALLTSTAAHADAKRDDAVLGLMTLPYAVGMCNSGPFLNLDEDASRAFFAKGMERIKPTAKERNAALDDLAGWSKEKGADEFCKIVKEKMLGVPEYAKLIKNEEGKQ